MASIAASILLLLLDFLVRRDDRFASSLSHPSPLRGYHFGSNPSTASSVKVTSADLRRRQPRSYVPDGMTEE
ncbi:hypothetical protein ACHAXA_001594 [Cyclostephanos tholiformis]|uniref:Secreted protein n=1 Tax=Cyclostephanos tholiformis TaxID=382380 RepID=A0ABD3RCU6_9STRA